MISLTLEHSVPISSPVAPGLTDPPPPVGLDLDTGLRLRPRQLPMLGGVKLDSRI